MKRGVEVRTVKKTNTLGLFQKEVLNYLGNIRYLEPVFRDEML